MISSLTISDYLTGKYKITTLYDNLFNKAIETVQLSRPEAEILAFLANNPLYDTAVDICKYRGFSKAYVSKALDQLSKKNYIQLQVDSKDRRLQHIQLTENAQPSITILLKAQAEFSEILLTSLSSSDQEILAKLFTKIIEKL